MESIESIKEAVARKGPFQGILAFSQGAALGTSPCYSGALPGDPSLLTGSCLRYASPCYSGALPGDPGLLKGSYLRYVTLLFRIQGPFQGILAFSQAVALGTSPCYSEFRGPSRGS